MKHKKLFLGILIPVGTLAVLFFLAFLTPVIPHKKVTIILPFAPEADALTGLIPMGETRFHPKPGNPMGHPGIDFGGQERFPLIASMDGTITKTVSSDPNDSMFDINLQHGAYQVRYFEVDDAVVQPGQKVKLGDLIAYVQQAGGAGTNEPVHYTTHWEFGSTSPLLDRWCPLTYFTPDSLQRINAIWDRVTLDAYSGIKKEFPDICSGDYEDRVEPGWMVL